MRYAFYVLILVCLPLELFARVGFFELLPNPAGDDTLGEYIELRNIGCDSVDMSAYAVSDASKKTYIFPSGTIIASHENRRFPSSETKIALNNSGDEAVYLKNASGVLMDEYHYSGTQRDNVIITITLSDNLCDPTSSTGITNIGTGALDTGSGTSFSGGMSTGSTDSGSVTGTGGMDNGSGSEHSTGSTFSDSGNTLPQYDSGALSSSGSTASGSNGSGISSSGAFIPPEFSALSMQYDDVDGDRKFDTLIITFSLDITGSFDLSSLALYSRSGGLSSSKIDTATGYITSATLSGNLLILTLVEQDLEQDTLHINNTTSSDLRLKTLKHMGFTSIYSQVPTNFLLTASFADYHHVSQHFHSGLASSGIPISTDSGSLIGSVGSGSLFMFPEIVPLFQNPTNATLSGNIFLCQNNNGDCRVNLTLDPIFTGAYLSRDYLCEVSTGSIVLSTCNPNTLSFHSDGKIEIALREKSHSGNLIQKEYRVKFVGEPLSLSSGRNSIDTTPPVIIIELDKQTKNYYEQINDNEFNCYTNTCTVNLTAQRSYDPDGSPIHFLWMYDMENLSVSHDPGTRKFGLGDHEIWLRVIDQVGNFSSLRYRIHVLGPRDDREQSKEKAPKKQIKQVYTASIQENKKPIKKIKMSFFSFPEILTQGSTATGGEDSFLCQTAQTHCLINLTLTGTSQEYQYEWRLSDGTLFVGKNPKTWKLPMGTHSVELRVYKKGENIPYITRSYSLVVLEKSHMKHLSKKKVKKPKKVKNKNTIGLPSIIPQANAASSHDVQDSGGMNSGLPFFLGFLAIFFSYRKHRRMHSLGEPSNT